MHFIVKDAFAVFLSQTQRTFLYQKLVALSGTKPCADTLLCPIGNRQKDNRSITNHRHRKLF
ncbi:hypothetical protein DPMN_094010 [Dreissena polymorpha]|uniref:Uncharacterized protein n=1 Tax=Dreissena polymorpha TaxID=45954 RepID=A0A9D4L4B6_DREPO|nr:hypothetical protein DPMN_094010 [Dreissena polymorpha]